MLQIQASHLSQWLAHASLGAKLDGMSKALLNFGPDGVSFLSGDQKSRAVISDCFLPKGIFSKYEPVGEFLIRDVGLLISALDLIDLAKLVDIYIVDGVIKLVCEEVTVTIVSAEPTDIGKKISEILTPDRKVFLKDFSISKVILDKIVKAATIMDSVEVRLVCDGSVLRFLVPSRAIMQEGVLFHQEVSGVPAFSVSLSSRFLKPIIGSLPGRSVLMTVCDGLVLFTDKDFFTNRITGIVSESLFRVALATMIGEVPETGSVSEELPEEL